MPRRFVTVEDLSRLQGRELVVDADTLVTPQALEAAEAAGIVIKSGSGTYVEPPPDRGPDAETAAYHLPHHPEPEEFEDPSQPTGVVVTVIGKNRAGVLAEITGALAARNVNVENISQRRIDTYFHLVLTVTLPPEAAFGDLKRDRQCMGSEDDYVVRVMHERVFRFMHRI
jgi:ACT domain-containing protein